MKRILMILLLIVAIGSSYAQTLYNVTLDVNGLVLGKTYTDAQMRAALGNPVQYDKQSSDMEEVREYRYGSVNDPDVFRHSTLFNDGFNSFAISSPKFKLFSGRLKVGDNISRVTTLKLGRVVLKTRGVYYLYVGGLSHDPMVISTNTNGIITEMSYTISI